jgi:hypothetical protein
MARLVMNKNGVYYITVAVSSKMFLLLEVEVADTMLPLVISMLANKRLEWTDGINFMIIVACL